MSDLTRPSEKQTLRREPKVDQSQQESDKITAKRRNKPRKDNEVKKDNVPKTKIPEAANDSDYSNQESLAESQLQIGAEQLISLRQENANSSELTDIASGISTKLTDLSQRLKEKQQAANSSAEVPDITTTSDVLVDRQNNGASESNNQLPAPVAESEKPSNSLIEPPKADGEVKGAPDAKGAILINAVGAVTSAVTAGFKKSISVVDKISGMLFKYTVTQAVNAAKLALAVLAVVLGIDLLKMAWQAWGEKIMEKFDEWLTTFKGWWDDFVDWTGDFSDMKTAFESMDGSLMGIKNAWQTGDWPALAASIGSAFLTGIKTLEGILARTVSKLIATILNALGFKDAAKSVEAEGLQQYQNMTNNRLSPENQKKLAEEQIKREKSDGLTPTQRGVTSFLPDKWRKNLGLISNDEYSQIQSEKKDQSARANLSYDDQVKSVAAANEAREAVARYKDIASNVNPNNQSDVSKADKYRKEAQDYINSPGLSLTPSIKAELQKQLDSLDTKGNIKNYVKPDKSENSTETQAAKNIKMAEAAKSSTIKQSPAQNTTVNNNIVKSNRTIQLQSPITSTRAPGIFRATGVN